ncbi:MAG TPA: hypothetical protein VFV41_14150 [Streptosporangiaceae bacterium]|nr:hypothetical protein [Streptosporangiaceae bacterium]
MLAAGYLTLRPVPATSASGPAGPAATTLTAVAARTASAIRCVALSYIVVQAIIWHSFYAADPRRLAGPAPCRPDVGSPDVAVPIPFPAPEEMPWPRCRS